MVEQPIQTDTPFTIPKWIQMVYMMYVCIYDVCMYIYIYVYMYIYIYMCDWVMGIVSCVGFTAM